MGIWQGKTKKPRNPIVSENPDDVSYLNAQASGIFVPDVKHGAILSEGDRIGRIIDPLKGVVKAEVISPVDGMLFTIREYPVVDAGSLIGRVLRKEVLNDDYLKGGQA